MKMIVKYRRARFVVDWDRPKSCQSCGLVTPSKQGIHCHHYRYEFTTEQVRKRPELLKKNTIWLCYPCHRVADALRVVEDNRQRAIKLQEAIKCERLSELKKQHTL